jgi:predicted Rossmann fold flavoprotein
LNQRLLDLGVTIHYRAEVKKLLIESGSITGLVVNMGGKKDKFMGDSVIIACGGFSYQLTGSTGDGYELAKEAGHTVTTLSPALVPFVVEEPMVKELQGLSLRNVEATILKGKKIVYQEFGEMLFTHYGVSGPVLLSASSYASKELKKGPLTLSIDLKPALTEEQLDNRLLRDFDEAMNKQFKNSLNQLYPAKLVPVMIDRSQIPPEKKVNEITKEERQRIIELTKSFTLTLTGLRAYNEAIITQGGVTVKEVNPSTMESKLVCGLYFAGEVLDLDAVTGGFNLQIAWSTGWAAGTAAGEEKDER